MRRSRHTSHNNNGITTYKDIRESTKAVNKSTPKYNISAAASLVVRDTTSLSRVSILSKAVNLLRGGNNSTGTKCREGAGEAGAGDSLHLLGGDPADDDGEDQGLLRDGLERAGNGGGEDGYAAIQASTRARIDGARGGCG
ncbi:hypothetical protein Tco_0321791 [Tanacetum coccineum]